MKHLVAIILVLCMCPVCGLAEEININAYSDAELVALLECVQQEIVVRHIEKTANLPIGAYIGGEDIPVGKYILTSAGEATQSGIVSLRAADDPEDDWPSKLYEFTRAEDGYSVFITVEEGDTLMVPYPFRLTISAGVAFM